MTTIITTSEINDESSSPRGIPSSTDLVVTFLGDCHGEFTQLISQFIDQGQDVLSKKIPVSTRYDYSIKGLVQNITTWRCCEMTNDDRQDRIHFMQFKPVKNTSHAPMRRAAFMADVFLIPVSMNVNDVSLLGTGINETIQLLCSSYLYNNHQNSSPSSSASYVHRRYFVLVFCSGFDEEIKNRFVEEMNALISRLTGGNNKSGISVVPVSMDVKHQVFDALRSIIAENKKMVVENVNNNNNNNNSNNSFFTASCLGISELPSARNANKRFAIVRSSTTQFIQNGTTIISFSPSNMGATFLVENHVPMFGTSSSSSSSSSLIHVLVLSDLHSLTNPSTGVPTPFFIPTLFDPSNSHNPKLLDSDGHGNAYKNRSLVAPFVFSDIMRDQSPLRPARFLFLEITDRQMILHTKAGRHVALFGLGGQITGYILDVWPSTKEEAPEKIRCVVACFSHFCDVEQLLFPSSTNNYNNTNTDNYYHQQSYVHMYTGGGPHLNITCTCFVRHVIRSGDFTMEILNTILANNNNNNDNKNQISDEISSTSFLDFLESLLRMTPRSCSSLEDAPWSPSWTMANFLVGYTPDQQEGIGGTRVSRNVTSIKLFNQSILDEFFTDMTSTFVFSHQQQIIDELATSSSSSWFYSSCAKTALLDPFDASVLLRNFLLLLSCIRRNGMGDRWLKEISATFFLPVAAFDPKIFERGDAQRRLEATKFAEPCRSYISRASFAGSGLVLLFGHCVLRREAFLKHAEIPKLLRMIDDKVSEESALVHCARGLPKCCRVGDEALIPAFASLRNANTAKLSVIFTPASLYRRLLARSDAYCSLFSQSTTTDVTFQRQRSTLTGGSTPDDLRNWLADHWMNSVSMSSILLKCDVFNKKTLANATTATSTTTPVPISTAPSALRYDNLPVEAILWMYVLNHGKRLRSADDNDDESRIAPVRKLDDVLWYKILAFLVTTK